MVLSATVSAWFYLPQLGMSSFELLSRSTAFITLSSTATRLLATQKYRPANLWTALLDESRKAGFSDGDSERRPLVHLLTSAHVVHPFRFPHYYKEQSEWLQMLTPYDVRSLLELRSPHGSMVHDIPLHDSTWPHPTADATVLHLENEFETLQNWANLGEDAPQPVRLSSQRPNINTAVSLLGHRIDNSGLENEEISPLKIDGQFVGHHTHRSFINTKSILSPMGMCGGPAVIQESSECIGIVEALVNSGGTPDVDDQEASGAIYSPGDTVVISSHVLESWIGQVEHSIAEGLEGMTEGTGLD